MKRERDIREGRGLSSDIVERHNSIVGGETVRKGSRPHLAVFPELPAPMKRIYVPERDRNQGRLK